MSFKTVQPGDPAWLKDAFSHLGLAEIPGVDHNQAILDMGEEVGATGPATDERSWCAIFANWVARRAGLPMTDEVTLARSFLDWGTDASADPRRGDFVVIKRGSEGWQGHVFLWLGDDGDFIWGIGGNQGKVGAVTVARFGKSALLGIRRPQGATVEAYPRPLVLAVQKALWERGYKQVGMLDGEYGRDTRGAIVAFELDHGLPPVGKPTAETLGRILAAPDKPISEVRSEATPADVREAAPEVKSSWFAKLGALVAGLFASLWSAVLGVLGNVDQAKGFLTPVKDFLGDAPAWLWFALVAIVAFAVWWFARQSEQRGLDAFRSGERR